MASSHATRTEAAVAISVRGLHRQFGAVRAIDGVDLAIARGELFGLIGHNGAGKSTLFRLMLGLLRPSAGCVEVDGIDVTGRHFREVRRAIGYLPENVVFYDNLSGFETLRFFARLKGADSADCAALLARVGLGHAARRRLREYSKGMRQRLGLAQALLGRPRLLFLDEPTTGLDPAGIRDFYAILRELQQEGVTIVLSSHILAEIQQRVDRLALMAAGRVHASGSVQSLRAARELPLRVIVTLNEGAVPDVRTALASLPLTLHEIDARTLAIDCPRASKLAVLSALSAPGSQVLDIGLHEASLEDLFFGVDAEVDDA